MKLNVVALRRDFHQHPELGLTEFRTASKIVDVLQKLGYEVKYGPDVMDRSSLRGLPSEKEMEEAYNRALENGADPNIAKKMRGGFTAVVGTLKGNKEGPTVAFLFDIDALPINESTDTDHLPQQAGFRSNYEGIMHACGHDGNSAIGLCLAEKMADKNFAGTIKLIFEPAEEGGRGAYPIVQAGIVNDVDKLFCMHLGMFVPFGEVCGGSTDLLASQKVIAHFYGVAAHAGAYPEKGRNALLGAATALLNIHAITRYSTSTTRVNVGVLQGGTAANVIPEYAKMIIDIRALVTEVREDLSTRLEEIVKHSALMHGLRYKIDVVGESAGINCDPDLISLVLNEAQKVAGFTSFKDYYHFEGSDDASLLINQVQKHGGKGTYIAIGTPIAAPHHDKKFNFGEEVLPMGVELLQHIAICTLQDNGSIKR
jgi:aminobenzoyl-glutamate utilization protein A